MENIESKFKILVQILTDREIRSIVSEFAEPMDLRTYLINNFSLEQKEEVIDNFKTIRHKNKGLNILYAEINKLEKEVESCTDLEEAKGIRKQIEVINDNMNFFESIFDAEKEHVFDKDFDEYFVNLLTKNEGSRA